MSMSWWVGWVTVIKSTVDKTGATTEGLDAGEQVARKHKWPAWDFCRPDTVDCTRNWLATGFGEDGNRVPMGFREAGK